jgi:SAM-dependent methyltransferase
MNTNSNPKSLGKKLIDLATDPEQYSTGEAVSWLQDPVRQDLQRQQFWNGIKEYIPKGCKSMLDVGCGVGWSAKKSVEIGITTWVGIEPATSHFDQAKKINPDKDIRQKTLEDFETDEKFDCVICIMIFSHIGDIDTAFRKLSGLMTPDASLIIVLSAFHEGDARFERRGRKYDVYEIDENQYVDKSVAGGYGISDINRRPSFYIDSAQKNGLLLLKQDQILDSGYSPKDLLVFRKSR